MQCATMRGSPACAGPSSLQHRSLVLSVQSRVRPGLHCTVRHIRTGAQGADGGTSTTEDKGDVKIKRTIAGLDALLGIQEEPKPEEAAASSSADQSAGQASTSAGPSQSSTGKAEPGSGEARSGAGDSGLPRKDSELEDQMRKIVEKAKAIADEPKKEEGGNVDGQKDQLQQEFEQLMNMLFRPSQAMDKAEIKLLRESGVFGPSSFWVTEIKQIEDPEKQAVLVRGNLRDRNVEVVFAQVCLKVQELFGSKYTVLLIDDPEASELDEPATPAPPPPGAAAAGGPVAAATLPRVAFQLSPTALVTPPPTTGWQRVASGVLLVGLLGSSLQLSLVANIAKLPKETLDYFSNPANLDSDQLPPGLENWDPSDYLTSAVPIMLAILGVNFMHELGHRIAANVKQVKLGPSFFIPNLQVGSFGAITPFLSLLKNRRDLWDVACAGPLAGMLVSVALLAIGLSQSDAAVVPHELLVPVPTQLFQGSLLLGSITRLALGDEAMRAAEVLISPLTIAGWCGVITNALNLLPVGSLDGGRMMQGAYGKQALSLSSFFTYVGLGLGFLGSSLSLPFGLYVLICQRSTEKFVQDNVTPAGNARQVATAVAVLTAILVLIPMAPELAESVGVGAQQAGLF